MARVVPTREVEDELIRSGVRTVAGMDEVGRGALAGPVMVGVVVVDARTGPAPEGLADSKMLTPDVVGERHFRIAQDVRRVLAEYEELKNIIAMLGMEELSQGDRATVSHARRLERFLTQPFFTTEHFTGKAGARVTLEQTLRGCERILAGEFKDRPERALYMIGAVDAVDAAEGEAG